MKPTVPQVLSLAKALYERSRVGCCLHIALDDGNTSEGDLQFCLNTAVSAGHEDCRRLAELLIGMSRTQRRKVYNSCR